MRTLYLDCGMGAAGDMLTAALLELLPEPDRFVDKLNTLGIPGVEFRKEKAVKCGITGTHMSVLVHGEEEEADVHHHDHEHEHTHGHEHGHHHHSGMHEIEHIVADLKLPEKVEKDVLAVYGLIAEAESHAHGVPVSDIHFHEVGTMDAVADITAVCLLMNELAPDEVIVITGGPCAGKTTAMSWIQHTFTERGYAVLFVPETATELITGGVAPWTCGSNIDYQACQMSLQMEKERVFQEAAMTMPVEKVLIVCDRGQMDNKAYMSDAEFNSILHRMGWNEVQLRDSYDAVFHLVTAANGALDAYTLDNNAARTETPEQARALDAKLISAWTGHPHLRVIDNSTGFQTKLRRLIAEISAFLGEPEPLEVERKYLIEYPDVAALEHNPNCQRVEMIQTYLIPQKGEEESRVRQRGSNGHYIYTQTTKKTISATTRVEVERRLTQNEYLDLLLEADPNRRPIRKTRYCITYAGQYFELDIYTFWNDKAILEIELRNEDDPITFPDNIKIICEVTGDNAYRNSELAKI